MHKIYLSNLNKISLLKLGDKHRVYGWPHSPRYDIRHTFPLLEKGCVRVIFIPHLMVLLHQGKGAV
jgi:hypothetical protein